MSRTDVVASPRLQTAPMRKRSSRASRRLLVLPIALLLAVALVAPTTALAAGSTSNEGLSGYKQTPTPTSGTSPSKETSTPKNESAPAKTSATPTNDGEKAKTLPFTGFDLRWTIGAGLLLMGLGFSIVTVQRRQRRDTGS